MDLDIGKLRGMKYSEIKEVAKSMNIRANVKADVLISAILSHIKLQSTPTPVKRQKRVPVDGTTEEAVPTVNVGTVMDSPAAATSRRTPKRRRTYDLSPENSFLVAELASENTPSNGLEMQRCIETSTPQSTMKSRLRNSVRCKSASVQTTPVPAAIVPMASKPNHPPPKEKSAIPRPVNRQNFTSKVAPTPDFKAIHRRAFKKLESVDEVMAKRTQKLNEVRAGRGNVKSIRTFGGGGSKVPKAAAKPRIVTRQTRAPPQVPVFRPTVFRLADADFDFAANVAAASSGNGVSTKTPKRLPAASTATGKTPFKMSGAPENVLRGGQPPKRLPFNLQASLNRKLGYVPHSGPLQPLKPIAPNNIEEVGEREEKRVQNRETLKGVRRNKRFELQLKARGIKL